MKKHNEGYSLVLVLVVLTLMSLVAAFILSFSLRNLQSQTAAVTRMQDEYKAAGEIEKVVAQLENTTEESITLSTKYENEELSQVLSCGAEQGKLVIEVYSGNTGIKCVLELVGSSISVNETTQTISITKPTDIQYLSYEHLTREVITE